MRFLRLAPHVGVYSTMSLQRFRGERSAPRDYSMAEDAEAAPAEVDEFEAIKLKYNALKAPVLWERELYTTKLEELNSAFTDKLKTLLRVQRGEAEPEPEPEPEPVPHPAPCASSLAPERDAIEPPSVPV